MIGMEAVNQLLVALEAHRFDFCFIGAAGEREIDDFLAVNPGLGGRFNRKLRFESYSPGRTRRNSDPLMAGPRATVLSAGAPFGISRRRAIAYETTSAERISRDRHNAERSIRPQCRRARRTAARLPRRRPEPGTPGSVTVEDLETLSERDIVAAVTEACAEKHVPVMPEPESTPAAAASARRPIASARIPCHGSGDDVVDPVRQPRQNRTGDGGLRMQVHAHGLRLDPASKNGGFPVSNRNSEQPSE